MNQSKDARRSRGEATRTALMDAAESLIAEHDSYAVPFREIVKRAGQKNESALHYHFGGLQGLIQAISQRRFEEVRRTRGEMLEALLKKNPQPTLRELCSLLVMPDFQLAKASKSRRQFIATFSDQVAKTPFNALTIAGQFGGGGSSGRQLGHLIRTSLSHLDEGTYRQRMDFAIRMASTMMGHHARQKNAFRGKAALTFVHHLIDAVEGMLQQSPSAETQALQTGGLDLKPTENAKAPKASVKLPKSKARHSGTSNSTKERKPRQSRPKR
jgi:AcrR family transcriptional regulator